MLDDKKCDNIKLVTKKLGSFNNSSKLNANRHHHHPQQYQQAAGSIQFDKKTNNKLDKLDYDDRKFNYKKEQISKKLNSHLYSLHDLYRNENNDSDTSQFDLHSQTSVKLNDHQNNIDNSSDLNANSNNNDSESTKSITTTSCSSSNSTDNEDENEEFQAIFKRISINKLLNDETNLNDKHCLATSQTTNEQTNHISSLKNLFKLLKLYKLEHYMNDLVDSSYCSTISLHKLKQNDLDKLNVSPYDKKKFLKLQIFIKQVMNTINLSSSQQQQQSSNRLTSRRSTSLVTNKSDANTLIDSKIKKMITIKKTNSNLKPKINSETNDSAKSASSSNLLAQQQRYLTRNFSSTILNENNKVETVPSWSKETIKPPVNSKLFTKNPNLPLQHTQNRIKRVIKTATQSSKQNRFSLVQRAKSSEPVLKKSTSNNLATNIASKSTTLIENQTAVNHPSQQSRGKTEEYFGPKISEINNIQFIKSKNFNYGLPTQQPVVNSNKFKAKSQIKKSKSNHHLNIDQTVPNIVTNDIYVYARKRPKLQCESQFTDVILVDESTKATICVNEAKTAVDGTPILRKNDFQFDKTFDSNQSNEDIYKSSIQPFIDQPAENKNDFTCICFGQTGSGKTHTLFGNKQQDGLCVLTAQTLFQNNERLICGFYEIYNGQLYDLLNQKNRLVLREDSNGQVNVVGLVEVEIKTLAHLRKTIEQAQASRHIGSTSFNKASSRSHAVFQFKVPNVALNPSASGQIIMTKQQTFLAKNKLKNKQAKPFRVLFIDLAGSERGIDAQTNQNDNRKEGAEINQSLLALKECIRCIDQFCSHAPFRQSKLTRVLRDCFIGYGRTVLIATVSPTDDCVSCSINTLQYANRVRQMTLRNRIRNEKLFKQTDQNKTKASIKSGNSDLPPTSDNRKIKKIYKDIFNDEELNKNLKNFVSSSPIAQDNFLKREDMLPSYNLLQKSSTTSNLKLNNNQNIPTLFHPSKINMSSTPIKTGNPNEKYLFSLHDDLMFENDTPVKGHKLKQIATQPQVMALADRYFAKVNQSDLNSKIYSKKNEDIESGVESEELSKSNKMLTNHQMFSSNSNRLTSLISKTNDSNYNADDSLCRLRQKQKELIESKKYLMHLDESTVMNSKLNAQRSYESDIEATLLFQNESFKQMKAKQADSQQTQLKTYIQSLENKLQHLRNEMNDGTGNRQQRDRSLSTDSCDSLKEIKKTDDRQKNLSILQEFVQQRTQLENHQKKLNTISTENEEKRKSFTNTNTKFGEEHEELFFKLQKQQLSPEPSNHIFENSIGSTSSDDTNNPDFKKSMHKGVGSTAFMLSKMKKSFATSSPTVKSEIFSPIVKVDQDNKSSSKSFDNDLTPRSTYQLVNPIPIRLSASSSDSTHINDDNQLNSSRLSFNKSLNDGVLTPSKLRISNSKIWKSASVSSPNSSDKKTWSSLLASNDPKSRDIKLSSFKIPLQSNESLLSHLSAFDSNNRLQLNDLSKFKNKDLLVVAHENQLCELTETCKKEMNLLSCLRDSQMGFDEYINKVEEMLSQKAHSIRDLQYQITQLKTFKHSPNDKTEQII